MIQIIEIRLSDYIEEAKPLFFEHWQEVAEQTGIPEPRITESLLVQMEEAGMIFTLGVFDELTLVGYSVNSIGRSFNFSTATIMENQGIFIKKQFRGRLAGIRLINESNRIAKDRGAIRAKWHTYKDSRANALFDSLGYHAHDIIYTKEL